MELFEDDNVRGIKIQSWAIKTVKKPILNAEEMEKVSQESKVPLPEICFGNNSLSLSHSSFEYTFNILDALHAVDDTGDQAGQIKVAHAETWSKSRQPLDASFQDVTTELKIVNNFDWTYTTCYPGTTEAEFKHDDSHAGIPMTKLASQEEPILFYEEIPLFEDELHDCGSADLTVRIVRFQHFSKRVMPSCFFVLSRFFLRVDGVVCRIYDTRIYHEFGTQTVIREVKGQEAPYNKLKKMLPSDNPHDLSPLSDPNWVAQKMGMLNNSSPSMQPSAAQWSGVGRRVDIATI